MDETNTRWFRWIADRAGYFFWGVWGAGIGTFGLVLTKAVDPTGATPPIYLGMVTVAMSALAALVTSRGMDKLADRRETARKINVAVMHIKDLASELADLSQITASMSSLKSAGKAFADSDFLVPAARVERAARASMHPPEFDAIIQNADDVQAALQVVSVFRTIERTFPGEFSEENFPKMRTFVTSLLAPGTVARLSQQVNLLMATIVYFERRVRETERG